MLTAVLPARPAARALLTHIIGELLLGVRNGAGQNLRLQALHVRAQAVVLCGSGVVVEVRQRRRSRLHGLKRGCRGREPTQRLAQLDCRTVVAEADVRAGVFAALQRAA